MHSFLLLQGIISTPDIDTLQPLGGGLDRILCLASDGVWAVPRAFPHQTRDERREEGGRAPGALDQRVVMTFLGKLRDLGVPAEAAARRLCDAALTEDSRDNVTCIVIRAAAD
jgi:serine/threonine protein phosphatase PrpC